MTRLTAYLAGLCAILSLAGLPLSAPAAEVDAAAFGGSNPKDVEDLRAIQTKVKQVVKKALPATVGISFGNAQGSGVIVSKDGTILTAGHVSGEPNQPCTVILSTGKEVRGRTLGANSGIDSGMIKITDKAPDGGWPFVEIGTTNSLKSGEWTIALGHPGGYRKDRPPVARLGRVLVATSKLIATDNTLINGDSGGPLFDLAGKLVGIHSRIGLISSQNIHVPIDTYKETWDRLAAGEAWGKMGNSNPAVLGVTVVETDKGCRVSEVRPNSPAQRAGLKVGDIITKFNSNEIKSVEELQKLMSERMPGRRVTLSLIREDKTVELTALLGRRRE